MKKILTLSFSLLVFYCSAALSQGIYNNGAKIVVQSGAYLNISGTNGNYTAANNGAIALSGKMKLTGNINNNLATSNIFVSQDPASEVIFCGSGVQTLGGSTAAPFAFQNLTVNSGAILSNGSKIANVSGTTNLNGVGNVVSIGSADFTINGALNGTGLFLAQNSGYLVRTPQAGSEMVYPIATTNNNCTVKITCGTAPTQPIKIKINPNKTVAGTIKTPLDFIDIQGEDNLNATIKLRIYKAAIAPASLDGTTVIRNWDGSKYVPILQDNVQIANSADYYEITITSVNKF